MHGELQMGASTIAALLLSIIPLDMPVRDSVDMVEVNAFYDENGKEVFQQLIWWNWNRSECQFDICDWRLVKDPKQIPLHGTSVFWDGQVLREVSARSVRRTWTQYDPELTERATLPKEQRKELTRPLTRQRAAEKLKGTSDGM